jgi:hypothetical protein
VVTSAAVGLALLAGFVAVAGSQHLGVAHVAPASPLPPEPSDTAPPVPPMPPPTPTAPPVTEVHPLPAALPAGSVVPTITWRHESTGVVTVTPSSDGVDVSLMELERKEWVPVPVPTAVSAVRLDATVAVTANGDGNHVGLACKTADHAYGATFSIDVNGQWFLSLDTPTGAILLDNAQSALIHEGKSPNQLSIVCIAHSESFEMLYAINGTVVADELSPGLRLQQLHPELYLCSCHGLEGMHDSAISVSSIPITG